MVKLNLACGQTRLEGFTGVDRVKTDYSDVVHELRTFPWPFESNSVEEAYCSQFVEHIPLAEIDGKDLFFCFFDELYRVLKPGAKAVIICPYGASDRAFQDPTHRRFIVRSTYAYLNKAWREANKLDHYAVECDFACDWQLMPNPEFDLKHDDAKAFIYSHYWNSVIDIHATIIKVTRGGENA